MFERLSEERAERPDQPEIKFFDESILEKLNRSKLNRHHHSVPFLEDTRLILFLDYLIYFITIIPYLFG